MNVPTITIPPEEVAEKLASYKTLLKTQRRAEDKHMRTAYKAAMSGKPIIDVSKAWRVTGLRNGYPFIALARADWQKCFFDKWSREFRDAQRSLRAREHSISIPKDVWDWEQTGRNIAGTNVPFMPPAVRPKRGLSKYHILFEVEKWDEYPKDPFLLRHITGWLFVVEEEWELTELEHMLLTGLAK